VPGPRTETSQGRVPPGLHNGGEQLAGWADT